MRAFVQDLAAALAMVVFLAGFSAVATGLAEGGSSAPAARYATALR